MAGLTRARSAWLPPYQCNTAGNHSRRDADALKGPMARLVETKRWWMQRDFEVGGSNPPQLHREELRGIQAFEKGVPNPGVIAALSPLGMEKAKVAPGPSFEAAHRRPPWLSMIDRQIDRPTPMPFDLVV
jgi:hypothetical protein